jgi:hypothetical protein
MNSSRRLLGIVFVSALGSFSVAQDTKAVQRADAGAVQPAAPQPGTAPRPATPSSGGNTWFPVTIQDLGTFFGTGDAVGTFKFKNPTDKPVEWKNLSNSCQCSRSEIRIGDRIYSLSGKPKPNILTRVAKGKSGSDQQEVVTQITIGPNEEGEVECHLDMQQIQGPKQASLEIHCTDPAMPHLKLQFSATGAQLFSVAPAEVNLNKMTWAESREFTVTVTSPLHKDWNILRMDDHKAFTASWEKSVTNGVTSWTIKGKYGPVNEEIGGGGQLKFFTDVRGESTFNVRVVAMVQGPLEVKPGCFLVLGLVRKGTQLKKEIVFEPNDGSTLEAKSFRFEKMELGSEFVTASQHKDGNKLVVELAIADNAPTGLLKGDLVVELNHPLVKEKRIMFNGFVR